MKKIVLWFFSLFSLMVLFVALSELPKASKEDRLATIVTCVVFGLTFLVVTSTLKIENKRVYLIHLVLLLAFSVANISINPAVSIIIIVLTIAAIVYLIFGYKKINTKLIDIDNMDGVQFENYCADLLKRVGYYNVKVTSASNDYGVDVLAKKNGIKYAVQCKRYSHKVDNSAVQEIVAGKQYYNCDRAIVITNNYYTDNAINLANANNVELWDRDFLKSLSSKRKMFKKKNNEITDSAKTNKEHNNEIINEIIAESIDYHKSIDDTKDLEANYTKIIQFDYDSLIDKSIAYGALLDYIPDDVKKNLFSVGALIPSREQLYPQFSFSEKEWEDCDKNFDKLCEYLKKKNVWYNKSLEDSDRYTESDFIKYVKDLLVGLHYENIVDTDSEMGVDITCSKDDIKYAIKCQHSISNKISVKPIRNIAAGKNYYHCQVGIVITNNYYSTTAIDMANANSIILWDRDKLQNIINGNV